MAMKDWKCYWNERIGYFEKIAMFYRRNFFALEGKFYSDKFFSDEGIFVECGSGTSACSIKMQTKERYGISLDLCKEPLKHVDAPIIKDGVQGTIFCLPFRDNTVDGIWNFGVMEHFKEDELILILKEFNRVLKKGGKIILFWPREHAPFSIFCNLMNYMNNTLLKYGLKKCDIKLHNMYPSVYTMFKNKKQIESILRKGNFSEINSEVSIYGLFMHCAVSASK